MGPGRPGFLDWPGLGLGQLRNWAVVSSLWPVLPPGDLGRNCSPLSPTPGSPQSPEPPISTLTALPAPSAPALLASNLSSTFQPRGLCTDCSHCPEYGGPQGGGETSHLVHADHSSQHALGGYCVPNAVPGTSQILMPRIVLPTPTLRSGCDVTFAVKPSLSSLGKIGPLPSSFP